jgi:hypothetical protein
MGILTEELNKSLEQNKKYEMNIKNIKKEYAQSDNQIKETLENYIKN